MISGEFTRHYIVTKPVCFQAPGGEAAIALQRGKWVSLQKYQTFARLCFSDPAKIYANATLDGAEETYVVSQSDDLQTILVPRSCLSANEYPDTFHLWLISSVDESEDRVTLLQPRFDFDGMTQIVGLSMLLKMLRLSIDDLRKQAQSIILHSAEISGETHYVTV